MHLKRQCTRRASLSDEQSPSAAQVEILRGDHRQDGLLVDVEAEQEAACNHDVSVAGMHVIKQVVFSSLGAVCRVQCQRVQHHQDGLFVDVEAKEEAACNHDVSVAGIYLVRQML